MKPEKYSLLKIQIKEKDIILDCNVENNYDNNYPYYSEVFCSKVSWISYSSLCGKDFLLLKLIVRSNNLT